MTKVLVLNNGTIGEQDVNFAGLNNSLRSNTTAGVNTGGSNQGFLQVQPQGLYVESANGTGDIKKTTLNFLANRDYTYWFPRHLPLEGTALAKEGNKAFISRTSGTDGETYFELVTPQRPYFDTTNRFFSNTASANMDYSFGSTFDTVETRNNSGVGASLIEFRIGGNIVKSGLTNDTITVEFFINGTTLIASQAVSLSASIYTGVGRGFELTGAFCKESITSGYFVQCNLAVSGVHDGISNFTHSNANASTEFNYLTVRLRTSAASSTGNVRFCSFKQVY